MGMTDRSGKAGDGATAGPSAAQPVPPSAEGSVATARSGGKKYAVVVGVDCYHEPSIPRLDYCVADAQGVADVLEQQCGFEKAVRLVGEGNTTKLAVLRALSQLQNRSLYPDASLVVFYFAGHGTTVGGRNYLLPGDGTADELAEHSSLALDDVVKLVSRSGCERRVLFIDACRSALGDGTRSIDSVGFNKDAVEAAAKAAKGLKIVFGTQYGRVASERGELGHGVFTHFLLEGLRGAAVDTYGQVSVGSLSAYIHSSMVTYSRSQAGRTRVPVTAGEGSDQIVLASFAHVVTEREEIARDLTVLAHRLREQEQWREARAAYWAFNQLQQGTAETVMYMAHCEAKLAERAAAASDDRLERPGVLDKDAQQESAFLDGPDETARLESALAIFDRAVSLDPQYAEAHRNRGMVLDHLGRYEEAIAAFDKALRLNPQDAEAYFSKAYSLAETGRDEEAIAVYDAGLSLDQQDASAFYNKGNSLLALGRVAEAIASYDDALRINPQHAKSYNNKGYSLAKLDRREEALAAYDEALRLNPGYSEALYNKGQSLLMLDRYEEAIAAYDQAIRLDPKDAASWLRKGICLAWLARHEEALAAYDASIRLDPHSALAFLQRGISLVQLDRHEEGAASWEQAREAAPGLYDDVILELLAAIEQEQPEQGDLPLPPT